LIRDYPPETLLTVYFSMEHHIVYGVDVGYGQVAEKLRTHERVSVIERTNLRYLSQLPQPVDLVTLDLSFISILLVGGGGIV